MNDNEVRRLLAILEVNNTTPAPPSIVLLCDQCDTPGVRNVAARGYCINHLGALYKMFDPANLPVNQAFGYQTGPDRPDQGLMYADLSCTRCDATWTGVAGELCWWCQQGLETMEALQAEHLLTIPDIAVNDPNYENRMDAWAERLAVAVEAELITAKQAQNVWQRAVKKADVA